MNIYNIYIYLDSTIFSKHASVDFILGSNIIKLVVHNLFLEYYS